MSNKSEDKNKADNVNEDKAELNSLKVQRRGHRSRITVLINEIKVIKIKTDSDTNALRSKIKALKTQRNKLNYYNKKILKYLPEEEQENEVTETEELNENIEEMVDEVNRRLNKWKISGKLKSKSMESLQSNDSNKSNVSDSDGGKSNQGGTERSNFKKLQSRLKIQPGIMENNLTELNDHLNKEEMNSTRVEALHTIITNLRSSMNELVEKLLATANEDDYLRIFQDHNLVQIHIEERLKVATNVLKKNEDKADSLTSTTCTQAGSNFRLERISLPKFDGTITQYLSWKTSFLAAVDSQNMSIAEKHMHLRLSLEKNALKLVAGLPQTDQYYAETLELLEVSFNDEIKIVQNHMELLFGLPTPSYEYQSLLDFNATFENNLRAIQSYNIGIAPTDSSIIIGHLISEKLPKQVQDEIHELKKNKHWTIELIRTALQESIKYLRIGDRENKKETENSINKTPNKNSGNNPRNNYEKPKYFQSTMTTTVNPTTERSKPEPSWNCRYCDKPTHFESDCSEYTSLATRRKRLIELKLCSNCLKPGHTWQNCGGTIKPCYYCNTRSHASSVCSQNPKIKPQGENNNNETTKEGPKTGAIPKVISSSCHVRQSIVNMKSVALPLAVLQINHYNKIYNVKTLLDSASQRTLINRKLVNKMKLRPYGKVKLQLNGINQNGEKKYHELVTLKVITNQGPIQIEALVLDKVPRELSIPKLARVTKNLLDMGISLANPHQRSDQIRDLDLIIGSDFYPLFEAKPYQINGINLLNTKVGSLIWGTLPNIKNNNNTASIFSVNVHSPSDFHSKTANTSQDLIRLRNSTNKEIHSTDQTIIEKPVKDFTTKINKINKEKWQVGDEQTLNERKNEVDYRLVTTIINRNKSKEEESTKWPIGNKRNIESHQNKIYSSYSNNKYENLNNLKFNSSDSEEEKIKKPDKALPNKNN